MTVEKQLEIKEREERKEINRKENKQLKEADAEPYGIKEETPEMLHDSSCYPYILLPRFPLSSLNATLIAGFVK